MLLLDLMGKNRLVKALVLFIVLNLVTTIHYQRHVRVEEMQIYSSYDVIFTTSRPSDAFCAWACHKSEGCVSFFYNKGSGACVGVKGPCQVSTSKNEDGIDMHACWTMPVSTGTSQPRDCQDVLSRNQSAEDGVYSITTMKGTELDVYCVMSTRGGGWTALMRRYDGSVLFNRTFAAYEDGFGDKAGEHWLGLRTLHEMTAMVTSEIHIYSFGGIFPGTEKGPYEEWYDFSIGPGPNYTLHVGELKTRTYDSAIPVDMFNVSAGQGFSAVDMKRDSCPGDEACSNNHGNGGFWYHCCSSINPTGMYVQPPIYGDHVMFNKCFLGRLSLNQMALMFKRTGDEPVW